MRLAVKIFLAYSVVILVLVGIAVWSLIEVGQLSVADRTVTVKAAEAMRSAVSLREVVLQARRLDMRSLVFSNEQYSAASQAQATRIAQELDRLAGLVSTDEEKALVKQADAAFAAYHATVVKTLDLKKHGDAKAAEKLLHGEVQTVVDRVVADLDQLIGITRDALTEATVALDQARSEIETLRSRTWKAVTTAMIIALLAALAGTAFIAVRMTRSLARLSDATNAVAEGQFHEPLNIDSKDEIGVLAKSFNSMAARLREIDEIKENFYATVAHELRSPVNAMREAARLLESKMAGPLNAKQERLIAILEKGCERLLRLVNDVLDLSRADAGMMTVERRWFWLDAAVTHAIDELRVQAEHRGVELRFELASGPERVFGDKDRIVQVVVNLVANALRFTPSGGSVTVRLDHTDNETQIQVIDTGIGIPAAVLPMLFKRFRQAHSGKGGTGLGLAIVKSLVEAHAGHVTVESEEGKGSRFTVRLPRQIAPVEAIDAEAQSA